MKTSGVANTLGTDLATPLRCRDGGIIGTENYRLRSCCLLPGVSGVGHVGVSRKWDGSSK